MIGSATSTRIALAIPIVRSYFRALAKDEYERARALRDTLSVYGVRLGGPHAAAETIPLLRQFLTAQLAVERSSAIRRALPPGTSRAKVTTANARWSTKCAARDRIEQELREAGIEVHAATMDLRLAAGESSR